MHDLTAPHDSPSFLLETSRIHIRDENVVPLRHAVEFYMQAVERKELSVHEESVQEVLKDNEW